MANLFSNRSLPALRGQFAWGFALVGLVLLGTGFPAIASDNPGAPSGIELPMGPDPDQLPLEPLPSLVQFQGEVLTHPLVGHLHQAYLGAVLAAQVIEQAIAQPIEDNEFLPIDLGPALAQALQAVMEALAARNAAIPQATQALIAVFVDQGYTINEVQAHFMAEAEGLAE